MNVFFYVIVEHSLIRLSRFDGSIFLKHSPKIKVEMPFKLKKKIEQHILKQDKNFTRNVNNNAHIFTFFYISRKKYWFRANFRFLVFDGFTHFRMSWTRFDYFWKMSVCLSVCLCVCVSVCLYVCVSVCVWQKFCGKCSSRTNEQNFMKLCI